MSRRGRSGPAAGAVLVALIGLAAGGCGPAPGHPSGGPPPAGRSATSPPPVDPPPTTEGLPATTKGSIPGPDRPTTSRPTTSRPTTSGSTTSGSTTGRTPPTGTACADPAGWTTARLAAETTIIPVQETDVAAAIPEVQAGAAGVVLFGSTAPIGLTAALAALQRAGPDGPTLLVMADEEGGGVQRLANLVGDLPWARTMAEQWTPAQITAAVAAVGARMRAAGVTMDLAPVVDVDGRDVLPGPGDPDGLRSFGGDPATVSADGQAYMTGLEAAGVIPVVKHFPGLGGATGNTDDGPAATLPWSTLQSSGLPPFANAIENGAPAVMVANAVVPGLSALPASLSPQVIGSVLEGSLGFRGLVVTDSLSAGAISGAGYSVAAAATQALRAGADLTLWSPPGGEATAPAQFAAVVASVSAAVAAGTLSRDRLVAAVRAVLTARHVGLCS